MNSNFEHQHLDYIIIRPWITDIVDRKNAEYETDIYGLSLFNRYTAHLLPADVREKTERGRRVLTSSNFIELMVPPSPTKEDLDNFCELVLDGFPGMDIKMTPYEICSNALKTIGFFPPRLWSEKTEMTVCELERRENNNSGVPDRDPPMEELFYTRKISNALERGEGLEMYRQIRRILDGDVDDDGNTWFRTSLIFFTHPFVSLETLEACAEYDRTCASYWDVSRGVIWENVIQYNPNAGPMLNWIFAEQAEDDTEYDQVGTVDSFLKSVLESPNAITYDYKTITQENEWLKKEIIEYFHRPYFVEAWMKRTGKDPEEFEPSKFPFLWSLE